MAAARSGHRPLALRRARFWLAVFRAGRALAVYPERTVRIVVPFAPGGGTDAVARTLAQEMAKDLGVSVIIENKPGAGTIVGTQAVAASAPDGYTLLMGTFCERGQSQPERETALRSAQGFRARCADRAFLQHRRRQSEICHSNDRGSDRGGESQSGQNDIRDFWRRHVRALAGELFKDMAKVNLTAVPYKGAAPGDHRPDRRPDRCDVHDGGERGFAGRKRTVARDRGDVGGALAGLSATADRRRGRRSRLCRRKLVWPVCAGRHAQ